MATFGGKLEVTLTLKGPSMIVVESQLEAIVALSKTEHGHL